MAPADVVAPTLCASRRDAKLTELLNRKQKKPRQLPKAVGGGRFEVEHQLGAGAFGEVFRGRDVLTKAPIAIKFDTRPNAGGEIAKEAQIMRLLQAPHAQDSQYRLQGVAAFFHAGQDARFPCLVMELLGKSVQERLEECGGRMKPSTVALIGEQAVCRLEYLHSRGIIHSDIKPENFMFGIGPKVHHLYLIDFGLSYRYWEDGRHVPRRAHTGLQGTMRYSSVNSHRCHEGSRRDDLEAVGHVLLYLLRGSLPWSGLPAKNSDELNQMVGKKKKETPLSLLCKGFPAGFQKYLQAARTLGFQERPDYECFRRFFRDGMEQHGPLEDYDFEWFRGQNLGELEPLIAYKPLQQPDDSLALKSVWSSLADSRLWGRKLAKICDVSNLY